MKQTTRIAIGLGVLFALIVCVIVSLLILANTRGPVGVNPFRSSTTVTTYKDKREIVCWGDSLTEGIGASGAIIDHVFFNKFTTSKFKVVNEKYNGVQYLSDHYPVYAVLGFPLK